LIEDLPMSAFLLYVFVFVFFSSPSLIPEPDTVTSPPALSSSKDNFGIVEPLLLDKDPLDPIVVSSLLVLEKKKNPDYIFSDIFRSPDISLYFWG
jgi:hypothetical protein